MCRVRLALCLIARDPVVEPALPLPGVLQNPLSVFDQGFAHALPRRWARDVPALTLFYQGFDELWGLNVEQIEVEWPGGLSPPGSPRTVREPLDSYGSRCSAISMT